MLPEHVYESLKNVCEITYQYRKDIYTDMQIINQHRHELYQNDRGEEDNLYSIYSSIFASRAHATHAKEEAEVLIKKHEEELLS